MRFLKEIIARKASAPEAELHADTVLDDEDFPDWTEDDGDEAIAIEPLDVAAPVRTEIVPPAATSAPQIEAPQAENLQDDLAEADQDDLAVKIWEMFDDEEVEEEKVDEAKPQVPALKEPDHAQGELAREALKSMIGGPPVIEKISQPKQTASNASPAAADELPVPRAGRMKTRMLGFHSPEQAVPQVFDRAETQSKPADDLFPVGWLVVIEGPGRGTSFPMHCGVSKVGRGADQDVRLDFGDNSISRDSHAVIAYDDDSNGFFVGHTGKANLVRLNGRPVLSTEEIAHFDLIRVGETTMRFVGFCGPEFAWDMTDDEEILHARAG